ncbi:MAG TPA: YihY/virulence factor BrkB family protein [Chloroflexia bacterium]|nr:YihY/virulence factor BrkB family protein [Chloroflexia bacterium]
MAENGDKPKKSGGDKKGVVPLLMQTFKGWAEDKAPRLGAALAYYTVFSIGPLLLLTISIASFFLDRAAVQEQIVGTVSGVVGKEGGDVINQTVENADKGGGNIIATVVGIGVLLFGASGVFGQLKDALNTIWEVQPTPGRGILATIKDRFLSFTMVLGTGFLLLVSLVVSAAVAALGKYLEQFLPAGGFWAFALNLILSLGIFTLIFALLFKFLPDVKIGWKDVWLGAFVTALLFLLGQAALAFYLSIANVGSSFGVAGSLVVVLVWIYYSAQILLLGAEFTQVYTNMYGSRVRPAEGAEFITEEARAQQGLKCTKEHEGTPMRDEGKPSRRKLRASPWFS